MSDMKIFFTLDEAYRKEIFLEGYELMSNQEIEVDINDLDVETRKFILAFLEKEDTRPPIYFDKVCLRTPIYNEMAKEVTSDYENLWSAKVNPLKMSSQEVLSEWLKDHSEALKEAEAEYEKHPS